MTFTKTLVSATLLIAGVSAFIPTRPSLVQQLSSSSSLQMTEVTNPTRDMTNPSTAFGRPLSDKVKDFDIFAVGLIKNVVIDNLFCGEDRSYARFYALETIARMPYFAYTR
jgi:hypothetical protein